MALIYFYVFMEWIFFVTKASFLSNESLHKQLEIFFIGSIPYLMFGGVAYLVLSLVGQLSPVKRLGRIPFAPNAIVAALFATILATLLVDNFTYTVFKSGIVRTKSHQVLLYGVAVFLAFCFFLKKYTAADSKPISSRLKSIKAIALLVMFAGSAVYGLLATRGSEVDIALSSSKETAVKKPNILLFASDGVDADRLSIYGYHRQTTPYLASMAERALIARFALSNAGRTTGSTTSMLTGKLPTTTKVFFPPHVLQGYDAFEHLPRILKNLGYSSIQETVRYYTDSADLNMRQAFDVANRRQIVDYQSVFFSIPSQVELATSFLFVEKLYQRVQERILHLLGVKKMTAMLDVVKSQSIAKVYGISDENRTNRVIEFIQNSKVPFFAHVHLMQSHCCHYKPERRVFSIAGDVQTKKNRDDFYDDTIVNSDQEFGRIVEALKESGKLGNTLIIYSSDHTEGWHTNRRLPLLLFFPEQEFRGNINKTVQLLDVTPTILDYIGVKIPDWMEGASLIEHENIDAKRPVFSVSGVFRQSFLSEFDGLSQLVGSGPPTYGMKAMGMTVCDHRYVLNLQDGSSLAKKIPNHPAPCEASEVPTLEKGAELITRHLKERGFQLTF